MPKLPLPVQRPLKHGLFACTLAIYTAFASLPINAAGIGSGKILQLKAKGVTNVIEVTLSGEIHDTPRCNENKTFALHTNRPGGQNLYDFIQWAMLYDLQVEIEGLGTCTGYWKAEDIKQITLKK